MSEAETKFDKAREFCETWPLFRKRKLMKIGIDKDLHEKYKSLPRDFGFIWVRKYLSHRVGRSWYIELKEKDAPRHDLYLFKQKKVDCD